MPKGMNGNIIVTLLISMMHAYLTSPPFLHHPSDPSHTYNNNNNKLKPVPYQRMKTYSAVPTPPRSRLLVLRIRSCPVLAWDEATDQASGNRQTFGDRELDQLWLGEPYIGLALALVACCIR